MPTCFVVMGYGVKTDFQQNKSFDLDKSYRYIIKPAAEAAGYTCERADEVQHAGIIDVPMYERLLSADLVIADLSTANVNAFFELGVRYALRPRTTIVMAEAQFKIPFDMGHVVIRHYEHLGAGIDHGEVQRVKGELADLCRAVSKNGKPDSPVYTFITDLVVPSRGLLGAAPTLVSLTERERRKRTQDALANAKTETEKAALENPLAAMMALALAARAREDFKAMREVLRGVYAAQAVNADPFVVQQLALATYKTRDPNPKAALLEAKEILKALDPEASSDPETLGLWGAIHKRLWRLIDVSQLDRLEALSAALWAHEKGFYLKNDYYNGINFAFLLNVRAAHTSGEDAIADRVQARRVRRRVVDICERLLAEGVKGENEQQRRTEEYWIHATVVEALFGLGKNADADNAFNDAKKLKPELWMIKTTEEQLAQLQILIAP